MTMLHTVWQKISGKHAKSMASMPASDVHDSFDHGFSATHDTHDRPDLLPDKYLPLWKLQSQRQIIEVTVSGNKHSFQTLIMAIDIQRGILWLDDLFPNQYLIELGDQLTLRHHRHGKELCFTSPIVAWGENYGASGIAIVLPENLSYKSRRQSFRCDLSYKAPITVKIRQAGQDANYGTLQDISLGGLRLSVAGNISSQLRHGAFLPVCELKLSSDLHICCAARIRAFRMEKAIHRCTHISVEFIDLSLEKKQQLYKFINELEHSQQFPLELTQLEAPRRSA